MTRNRRLLAIPVLIAVWAASLTWYFNSGRTRIVTPPPWLMTTGGTLSATAQLPRPAHVVVVIEENKSYAQIVGNVRQAPYLNALIAHGALFTRSYGVAHPSQPNYIMLFAGRTNANGDGCALEGVPSDADNLGAELLAAKRTFVGYAEDLPRPGYRGCVAGNYVRKHAPWMLFTNVPDASIQPLTTLPSDWDRLPTLSFVIPNILDDMHSGSIRRGDDWLRQQLGPLIAWAAQHDTLVVITWDESSAALTNHIPTLFFGPMVKPGRYDEPITHDRVLRTLEDLYGLPYAGQAANDIPIEDVWAAPAAVSR